MVGGASVLIWLMMSYSLRQAFDQMLRTEAMTVASRLETDRGRIELELAPDSAGPVSSEGGALVKVFEDGGRIVFSSPELADTPELAVPAEGNSVEGVSWFDVRLGPSERPYRGAVIHPFVTPEGEPSARSYEGAPAERRAWVFAARPLAPLHAALARLAVILSVTVGIAAAGALVVGLLLSGSGTEPIRSLSDHLGRVRPERPAFDLDRRSVPIELDPIVGTVENLLSRIRLELDRQRQLTADVAHDLRTPLAGVRTLLDVCVQRPRETREYVETIEKAQAALRQLSAMVDNVLTLARLDAQVDRPVWESVSLPDVVNAAVATVQPLADGRGVAIRSNLDGVNPVRSERAKLTKILSNLLANAVEHSPAGEAVVVTAGSNGTSIEIAVEDRGPGVAPELRAAIFERFTRGDDSRTTDGHHGLGLTIARGLARVLGGDVMLDGSYAGGSRFVLKLNRTAASD